MAKLRADRLIKLRTDAGLSQAQLAEASGVGQSTIARLEAGDTREPRSAFAVAKALGCTVEYLFGEVENTDESGPRSPPTSSRKKAETNDQDLVELDEIDLRYGLGGTFIDSPVVMEKRQFSRAWLRNVTRTSPEHLFWAVGDGDSMEPTIRSGEIVLIDKSRISPQVGDGIWAMAWGDIGMIKRLRPRPDGSVEILSDNQLVPPAIAVDGELHVIGKVIAVVRRL